jgi:hypothetical protein
MVRTGLVAELFDGPIDIVGDVHGEIHALRELRRRLGYDDRGRHPEGRRLVFVGDLADRGPDSPGVIEWVRDRIRDGRAQCVLGNHDFNALRAAEGGPMKTELSWIFDEARPYTHHGYPVPQVLIRGHRRDDVLAFFRTLPIALERKGELPVRVVHACWQEAAVDRLRLSDEVLALYRGECQRIWREIEIEGLTDRLDIKLAEQNRNAIKRVTSGLEVRSGEAIEVNNEPRYEKRAPWWADYADPALVVFGHYWRVTLPNEHRHESLFHGVPPNALHGRGPAMCVDYSAGKRYKERMQPGFAGTYRTHLAALRLPERVLYFDNAPAVKVEAAP